MLDKTFLRPAVTIISQGEQTPLSEADSSEAEEATPIREPCKLYMAALKIMDVAGKKASVDTSAWTALCKLRRAKVEAEIRVSFYVII
jgi:hypothetical protein